MKIKLGLMLLLLWLVPTFTLAEGGIVLDEAAVFGDMPCSWAQGYEPSVSGNTLLVHVPLAAVNSLAGSVKIELFADNAAISPFKLEGTYTTAYINEAGSCSATLKVPLVKGRINGDYPCKLVFTAKASDGTAARGEFPFVLHIRDGRKPEENIRPVISNVDAALRVGEDCTLTAVLTNASQYADLTNLMLHVTDASGDVLPAGTDALLLSDMTAGSTQAVSVPLKVKADAAVSLHTLRFDLSWTALDAAGTWSESFTLPINQEIRLEQGGVQMASTILQGDMATLTIPLMNMGRADLNNVMATLSLPGITERQSVLVGTIAPGETKQAKLTFYPGTDALGLHQGTVTMTGEDAYGNMTTLTERVETTVEAPAPAVVVANGTMGEKDQPVTWMVILLGSSCCVLIILLMIDGTRLRKKIRKLEEERL